MGFETAWRDWPITAWTCLQFGRERQRAGAVQDAGAGMERWAIGLSRSRFEPPHVGSYKLRDAGARNCALEECCATGSRWKSGRGLPQSTTLSRFSGNGFLRASRADHSSGWHNTKT
jgi:hypothetical protein